MFETEQDAIKLHESLSKLYKEKPEVFKSVVDTMISKNIKNSSCPKKLKQIQNYLNENVLDRKQLKLISSLLDLKNKFK